MSGSVRGDFRPYRNRFLGVILKHLMYLPTLIFMRVLFTPNDERKFGCGAWLSDVVQIFWSFDSAR